MPLPEVIPSPHEYMTYLVRSSSNPGKRYRCDLVAENGYGWCECVDFGTRRWPNIKPGAPMGTRDVLCRHLILARDYFLNALLVELAKKESK